MNAVTNNGNSKNGAMPPADGLSSRQLSDTIARLETMRQQVQKFEASEAELQNRLSGVQELIAQKQLDLDDLEDKLKEKRQAQATLEQLLFATTG